MQGNSSDNSTEGLVTARGTGEGLVIRLDSQAETETLIEAVKQYVGERQSFISGNPVILDWGDGIPADDLHNRVTDCLCKEFDITIKEASAPTPEPISKPGAFQPPRSGASSMTEAGEANGSGLFGGIETLSDSIDAETTVDDPSAGDFKKVIPSSNSSTNSMFWDNPDAMIIRATLRSGQKIETENSIVLAGDVNFGAEIVAGGDVIVMGTLRGVVHAGAYDETGGGRFIFALDLRPTQLRIGSVISRGTDSNAKVPEIAYVDGTMIVVENYNSRNAANRLG